MLRSLLPFLIASFINGSAFANVNTDFFNAVSDGDLKLVQSYLEQGLSVESTDRHGRSILLASVLNQHLEITRLLLQTWS